MHHNACQNESSIGRVLSSCFIIIDCFYQIGILRGFDDYVNMVLDDVIEYTFSPDGTKTASKLESILLNGNNIAIMVPGGECDETPEDKTLKGD